MNTTVKKLELPELQATPQDTTPIHSHYLDLMSDITVTCTVLIGSFTLSIKELKQLHPGQVLPLIQKTTEPVDIILNDHRIARGELMSCDDQFAVRITELLS